MVWNACSSVASTLTRKMSRARQIVVFASGSSASVRCPTSSRLPRPSVARPTVRTVCVVLGRGASARAAAPSRSPVVGRAEPLVGGRSAADVRGGVVEAGRRETSAKSSAKR